MAYEVTYIDGLAGAWVAQPMPTPTAPIRPYNTGQDGGFAYQAPRQYQPPVGSPTRVLDDALAAETYTTPTGARAWKPTAADDALIDAVTQNPYQGLDELLEAGARGAGRNGIQNLPYVGDVIGGAVEGAVVYGNTGSVTHGVFAGAGSSIGGVAGTAIGASLGAVGGPVGVAVGGLAGGAVGSAFGSAAGKALANLLDPLPVSNANGAPTDGPIPFEGGQSPGVLYNVQSEVFSTVTGQWGATSNRSTYGPVSELSIRTISQFQQEWRLTGRNQSNTANVTQTLTNGVSRDRARWGPLVRADGQADVGGNPAPTQIPYSPTTPLPVIPRTPGIRLPQPTFRTPNLPSVRPRLRPTENPLLDPKSQPIGSPFGVPNPFTGIPTFPDFGLPGTQPSTGPHNNPYPDIDPVNPNPTEQPGEQPGECDPCKGIQQIKDKLEQIFSQQFQGSISLFPCEEGSPSTLISNDVGLAGLSAQITILSQAVTEVWEKVKCPPIVESSLPESWAVKTAKSQPQYVITWRPIEASGSRWTTAIPHPKHVSRNNAYAAIDNITYSRGDVMLNFQHEDNSSCIFNVDSREEALRMSEWIKSITDSNFADTAYPKITEGLKERIAPREVQIANIKYYSTGQRNLVPDWVIGFDKDGNKILG